VQRLVRVSLDRLFHIPQTQFGQQKVKSHYQNYNPTGDLCDMNTPEYMLLSYLSYLIIIILRHQLGLDRPVSASSNGLFKGIPSRLRPFGSALILN
jgi:hypothetical protein